MQITFWGAVREVTGSMHMIQAGEDRILLDCGMYQGRRKEAWEKNRVLPIDPALITNMVLSHAHIDHSGRIPLLVKEGFQGEIFTTRATADICGHLLPDSAHIQESDADYLNYKRVRKALQTHGKTGIADDMSKREIRQICKMLKDGDIQIRRQTVHELIDTYGLDRVSPLYTGEDAQFALGFLSGVPYRTPVTVGKGVTCTFYEAGHILGSAVSVIRYTEEDGRVRRICFTGDLGRFGMPILRDPCLTFREEDREIDLLVIESTYGNRRHESAQDLSSRLGSVMTETVERGGSVVIPSFALGRAQEMIYVIHELFESGDVPRVPVFIDSPLTAALTTVFGEHPELYNTETHKVFLERGMNPFEFEGVHFVSSVEESMNLMRRSDPCIVISASGMCEVGRILHHLRYRIHNPVNTILIVGFMAQNTLGRRIQELGETWAEAGRKGPAPEVKILGKEYPLKAGVVKLGGFSAHADMDEMTEFLTRSNLKVKRAAVVHGEEEAALAFSGTLKKLGIDAVVPRRGQTLTV